MVDVSVTGCMDGRQGGSGCRGWLTECVCERVSILARFGKALDCSTTQHSAQSM